MKDKPINSNFNSGDSRVVANRSSRGRGNTTPSSKTTGTSGGSRPKPLSMASSSASKAGARPASRPSSGGPTGRPRGTKSSGGTTGRPLGSKPSGGSSGRTLGSRPSGGSSGRPLGSKPKSNGSNGTRGGQNTSRPAPRNSGKPSNSSANNQIPMPLGSNPNDPTRKSIFEPIPDSNRNGSNGRNVKNGKNAQRPGYKGQPHSGNPNQRGKPRFSAVASNRKKKKGKRNVLKTIIASIAAVFFICMAGAVLYGYNILKDVPAVTPENISDLLSKSSTLYDDTGAKIENIYIGDGSRVEVSYEQMPANLTNAFIALEDKTFWTHNGFNFVRMAGAVKDAITGDGRVSGTSTITQQLARNIWMDEDEKTERSLDRKLKEAYYAVQIERKLDKETILTNYLNAIWLGNRSFGVQAASQAYFGKNVEELDLLECASLAILPQSPTTYSMISAEELGTVADDDPNLLLKGNKYAYVYNDVGIPRIKLTLDNMLEQKMITKEEYDLAITDDLRAHIKPSEESTDSNVSFFLDYVIEDVAKGLMKAYPDRATDMDTALRMVYTGGYNIQTTLDLTMQQNIATVFSKNSNFPDIVNLRKDNNGNIIDDKGQLILYKYSNLFDGDGVLKLGGKDAAVQSDGSIILFKGGKLNFYETEVAGNPDISIELKDIYRNDKNGIMSIIKGGFINVPQGFKSLDAEGNCIVSAEYIAAYPEFFAIGDTIMLVPGNYSLNQSVVQPQSACVILENQTGHLKAIVGGRRIVGEMNYNRALSPRQPGSSIKPVTVYGAGIEMSARGEPITSGDNDKTFGKYFTPMSILVDREFSYGGKVWPKNFGGGYMGSITFRKSLEQSRNVTAVKVQLAVGTKNSTDFAKSCGITSIVEDGEVNDMNPAALALGGMTRGVSPLQMASAYSAFANAGIRIEPISYTSVTRKDGSVVLDGTPVETRAMDEGTAFIINDMLRTTVTRGICGAANITGIPVAGKTGTTSDNCDAWFVGNTPRYSASVWIGNDVNLELSQGSAAAMEVWRKIMKPSIENKEVGKYPKQPANVVKASVGGYSDFVIKGTAPSNISMGSGKLGVSTVSICNESGFLATGACPSTTKKTYDSSNGESAPAFYCNIHNDNPGKYPINPDTTLKPKDPDPPPDPPPAEPPPTDPSGAAITTP